MIQWVTTVGDGSLHAQASHTGTVARYTPIKMSCSSSLPECANRLLHIHIVHGEPKNKAGTIRIVLMVLDAEPHSN